MVDEEDFWGAPIFQQSIASLEWHIGRKDHAVRLSKRTEITDQERWQNRRRTQRRRRRQGSCGAQPAHVSAGAWLAREDAPRGYVGWAVRRGVYRVAFDEFWSMRGLSGRNGAGCCCSGDPSSGEGGSGVDGDGGVGVCVVFDGGWTPPGAAE